MRISESLTLTPRDESKLQNALIWLSNKYSAATHGLSIEAEVEKNGSDASALITLTIQSILHKWSKEADVVIETDKPLKQLAIYNQLEAALLAVLANQTN